MHLQSTIQNNEKSTETTINSRKTAKIHVSQEVADLIKIYCVLHRKKMAEFTTEILTRELNGFKQNLKYLRRTQRGFT